MNQGAQPIPLKNKMNGSQGEFKRLSLRDAVIERMKQAIIKGELVDGQKVTELELAEWLGVSRGLVREVIRELENTGILVNIPYKGTFVRSLTSDRINELYTLRSLLEEYAIELAVVQASEDEIAQLREILATMTRYAQAGDVNLLVETDLQFHLALYAMSKHQMLIDTLERLSGQTHLFIQATKAMYSIFSSLEEAASSHQCIVDALENRDVNTARSVIRKHICEVGERLVVILQEKERIESNLSEIASNSMDNADRKIPLPHPLF